MDAIAEYVQAKHDLINAKKWEAMIGSTYHGGGGGVGRVVGVELVQLQIYHQHSNGATNYHSPPNDHLAACIRLIATNMAPTIIAQAIGIMERGLVQQAMAAKVLADAIAADAAPSLSSTN